MQFPLLSSETKTKPNELQSKPKQIYPIMKIGTYQDGIDLPGLLLVVGNDAAHEIGIRVSKQIQQY
jgi:hypothetical protein